LRAALERALRELDPPLRLEPALRLEPPLLLLALPLLLLALPLLLLALPLLLLALPLLLLELALLRPEFALLRLELERAELDFEAVLRPEPRDGVTADISLSTSLSIERFVFCASRRSPFSVRSSSLYVSLAPLPRSLPSD
jgi:hypothetical protein